MGGGLVFWTLEADGSGWSFTNALYFYFVTLSGVGFSNVMPQSPIARVLHSSTSLLGLVLLHHCCHRWPIGFMRYLQKCGRLSNSLQLASGHVFRFSYFHSWFNILISAIVWVKMLEVFIFAPLIMHSANVPVIRLPRLVKIASTSMIF